MTVKSRIAVRIAAIVIMLCAKQIGVAQTGGPGQPEFMQFKPATATDLVNPSNGSFSYNIPLFDVGGYPVNLSYQSGIGMEDVASVVGLGWNVNVGAVTHSMRGLPDDFKGENVTRKIHMRPNVTYGGNLGIGLEIVGFPMSLKLGYGIFYNSYKGWGVEQSMGLGFSIHEQTETFVGGMSLGMKANTQSGVDLYAQPSVSLDLETKKKMGATGSLGGLISVNSSEGLKGSIDVSMSITDRRPSLSKAEVEMAGLDYQDPMHIGSSASYSFSKAAEIPRVSYPFRTLSFTGAFKAGGEMFSLFPHGELSGYYSKQELKTNEISTPAYGYLYSDQAPSNSDNILHDFNREKDQPYVKDASVNIGIPSYTNDVYSVNAQGISGSFQLHRGDIGVIHDNRVRSDGFAANIEVEVGFGNLFHAGAAVSTTFTSSTTGKWSSAITPEFAFKSNSVNSLYQSAYFKNASDVSVDENHFFHNLLDDRAVEVNIKKTPSWKKNVDVETELINSSGAIAQVSSLGYHRANRDPRTINIQYKTASQASAYGVNTPIDAYRMNSFQCDSLVTRISRVDAIRKEHHISEMTSTNTDGMRYVFGLPTYNLKQKEVSFTLERARQPDTNGLVSYNPNMNWGANGTDGFYESTELPPYVTSHLLTAVLSPEYIDVDGNGPSLNDVGNYVKINYSYAGTYKWRTPYDQDKATFNRAFLSDPDDNKGSYVFGEKELWYTHSIESKTQIAEFYYDVNGRTDGLGVAGEHGGKAPNQKLYALDSIKVYSINERVQKGNQAVPIRIIYFNYDYSLCGGINNSANNTGKLTLKKVAFASGKSRREVLSPYKFTYGVMPNGTVVNPPYKAMNTNRWGNYQENTGDLSAPVSNPLSIVDSPYSSQDEAAMKKNAFAWNLTGIKLPSGGSIAAEYEPHRYAYTQDKRCMQMFALTGIAASEPAAGPVAGSATIDRWLGIKLAEPITGANPQAQLMYRYFDNDINQSYYYKTLVTLKPGYEEWISGYCRINQVKFLSPTYAAIELVSVPRDDNGNSPVSPIIKNAWQFMRMNRPDISYGPAAPFSGNLEQFLKLSDLNQRVGDQLKAFFKGFNKYADQKHFANTLDPLRSFIRLYSPERNKIIGGSRVRRVVTNDDWHQQSQLTGNSKTYTIDYDYTRVENDPVTGLPDTISSGVMEYEPFVGQDENPLRQPIFIDQNIKMAPDNMLYTETPFNESLFPAPNLTYSNVRVTSNKTALNTPGKGYQVLEFYTAKDYPVSSDITDLGNNHEKKTSFLSSFIMSLFGFHEYHDYVTLSQGASITLNDMHGKQRATSNFNNNGTLVSSERYEYSLGESLNLIGQTDAVYQSDKLGVSTSAIYDSRSSEHSTFMMGKNLNLDVFLAGFLPIPIPLAKILPNVSIEKTRINTAAFNKIITKKGILKKKTVTENGASVSTENVLFDDKTGVVVLSKTTNEFNDSLYKFTYPAHWIYNGVGASYLSSDLDIALVPAPPNSTTFTVSSLAVFGALVVGDEIVVPTTGTHYWIVNKTLPNKVQLSAALQTTSIPIGSNDICRVLRPGRRNQLLLEAGSVVSRLNPIVNNHIVFSEIGSSSQIINASMQELNDVRIPYCKCDTPQIKNLYVTGERGNWYPNTTWAYLTDRERSVNVPADQTNIRVDGAFSTFKNFWKFNSVGSSYWNRSITGWQWVETVTKKDVNGITLETSDVLGRHNALLTGYKNKLVVAEAGNASINEVLYESFEDWNYIPIAVYCGTALDCVPRIVDWSGAFIQDTTELHTGKYSGKLIGYGHYISIPVVPPSPFVAVADSVESQPPERTTNGPCAGTFTPTAGTKYVLSAWVRDNADPLAVTFAVPAIQIGSAVFHTSGNIIDGWQRIYGEFTIPAGATSITAKFIQGAGGTWFDDIRVFPFDAKMITYVYDANTQKLTFTSDENNYFAKYNYDASDNLESINKETEKGVLTIKEARSGIVKQP